VHAVADQGARDVALILSDPRGRQLLHVDSLTAESELHLPAEEVHWVADAPGDLRIALESATFKGPCGLRLIEHRRATEADRQRALAEAELARAHDLRRTKEPKSCRAAVAPYESAERRFEGLDLPRRQAEILLGLGQLQRDCLHDNDAALQTFARAEPLFSGNPAFESRVRQHRGELRDAVGDLDGAIREYRQALELRQRLGDRPLEALTSNTLGRALYLLGHYDEAAVLLDRSLALWKPEDGPEQRAQTLLTRGHLHRDLGETDRARKRFQEALPLFRQAGDRDHEAAAWNALGMLANDAGRPAEALEPLQKSLALRAPGSRGQAVTLNTLGAVYRQLGRPDDALRAYEEALPIFIRLGESREQARCLGNLGRLEAGTRDTAAIGHFDRAVELFRTLGDSPNLAWALEGKAWVLRRSGNLEAARGLMEEALDAVERHRFSQASFNTRAEFFSTRQNSYDFLIDLLMEMGRKADALEVSERSLARSLLDGLAAGGTSFQPGGADPKLRASEREIEQEIDWLVSRQTRLSQDPSATPEQLRDVETELGRRWDDLDRVRAGLRASDPRYAALTQPEPWKAGDVQRRLLDRDTLLLEYRLGKERSYLWAVTPDSLETFELPGQAEVEQAVRPACDLTARSRIRKAEISAGPQLAKVSRLLLGPVAPLLPGKRLLVVGDGILQNLPFAALPEPGSGEPLIARHEIVSLPSVSVLGVLRQEAARRPPAPKTLWVLANPDFGPAIEPLPYTGDEAAAILALVPPAESFAVQRRQAVRAAVLGAPLRDYRILHFATHGLFAATEPGGGRLVLAQIGPGGRPEPYGFLYLADVYELSLRADLVVLSACQSALGREVRGEGMMGMTRGFFYAGAERVLVSLWNVNDRASVELMRRFYQELLKEGLSPAAALRKAQNEIRRTKGWEAPYYWAGFTLQGEWRGERPRHVPSPLQAK
jgi:CHAT domain-containing protein/tetratricopeptide (TPR) repeat protein